MRGLEAEMRKEMKRLIKEGIDPSEAMDRATEIVMKQRRASFKEREEAPLLKPTPKETKVDGWSV